MKLQGDIGESIASFNPEIERRKIDASDYGKTVCDKSARSGML